MPELFLLDPPPAAAWYPFAESRPICELRAGAWLIRERWEAIADATCAGVLCAPHLAAFVEDGAPRSRSDAEIPGPAVVGRSQFAPTGVPIDVPAGPARLVNDGEVVGWSIPEGMTWGPRVDDESWESVELEGMVLAGGYDLLTALEHFLPGDVADFTQEGGDAIPEGSVVLGDPHDVVILGATIEPGVTFDARRGPIVVEQHAYIFGGTRLQGPLYVGAGSQVLGGPVEHSAIGPRCKVRGEISGCVLLGFANKAHEGFLGHSVVGRWVNLGAGTTTSNLKNTYGPVRLQHPDGALETGRQFLGSLIGDHAKTAIGTMLGTGTLVGTGANIFGGPPGKYVPAFAWGTDGARMRKDGFLAIAERVLPRRNVEMTDEIRAMLERIYDHVAE